MCSIDSSSSINPTRSDQPIGLNCLDQTTHLIDPVRMNAEESNTMEGFSNASPVPPARHVFQCVLLAVRSATPLESSQCINVVEKQTNTQTLNTKKISTLQLTVTCQEKRWNLRNRGMFHQQQHLICFLCRFSLLRLCNSLFMLIQQKQIYAKRSARILEFKVQERNSSLKIKSNLDIQREK